MALVIDDPNWSERVTHIRVSRDGNDDSYSIYGEAISESPLGLGSVSPGSVEPVWHTFRFSQSGIPKQKKGWVTARGAFALAGMKNRLGGKTKASIHEQERPTTRERTHSTSFGIHLPLSRGNSLAVETELTGSGGSGYKAPLLMHDHGV